MVNAETLKMALLLHLLGRLENEHLNNVGKYRAFKSVPLPFHHADSDGSALTHIHMTILSVYQQPRLSGCLQAKCLYGGNIHTFGALLGGNIPLVGDNSLG
eukprot:Gb_22128 [translate_table: standard]